MSAVTFLALYLAFVAALLWAARRLTGPTRLEPTAEQKAEREAMRQELIDQLVEDWGREIEFSLDDVVEEWAR